MPTKSDSCEQNLVNVDSRKPKEHIVCSRYGPSNAISTILRPPTKHRSTVLSELNLGPWSRTTRSCERSELRGLHQNDPRERVVFSAVFHVFRSVEKTHSRMDDQQLHDQIFNEIHIPGNIQKLPVETIPKEASSY